MAASFTRRFTGRATATQVLHEQNLDGKVVLVTGGTSGIGTATVESLAVSGADVIFTGRNQEAASQLISSVQKARHSAKIEFMPLNLSSFHDVKRFAEEFLTKRDRLDVVILNAGMFGGRNISVTEDGYESTFQVNVLSQLYLLELLRELLVKSAPARVVFVSSTAHKTASISPTNLSEAVLSPPSDRYGIMRQYANSKMCQILLALHLQSTWMLYVEDGCRAIYRICLLVALHAFPPLCSRVRFHVSVSPSRLTRDCFCLAFCRCKSYIPFPQNNVLYRTIKCR